MLHKLFLVYASLLKTSSSTAKLYFGYTLDMDSLNNILSQKDFEEPPEVAAIKQFVQGAFHSAVGVTLQPNAILITAPSSALIGSLRLETPRLQAAAGTSKRLIFRIGS